MSIRQLAYLKIGAADVAAWRAFAENILGLMVSEGPGGVLCARSDERDLRYLCVPSERDRLVATGLEVADESAYRALRKRIAGQGITIYDADDEATALLCVQQMFGFDDPAGNRIEVSWGSRSSFAPFVSPAGVSGFITGDQGAGHVVLPAPNIEEALAFWRDTLGFGLSDLLKMSHPKGDFRIFFLHCDNPRQHSVALGEQRSPAGCLHIFIEVASLLDLGRTLDRVQNAGHRMLMSLGQHVNDDCLSFYFFGHGSLVYEVGWQSTPKDWSSHSVFESTRGSHWGHRFAQ